MLVLIYKLTIQKRGYIERGQQVKREGAGSGKSTTVASLVKVLM